MKGCMRYGFFFQKAMCAKLQRLPDILLRFFIKIDKYCAKCFYFFKKIKARCNARLWTFCLNVFIKNDRYGTTKSTICYSLFLKKNIKQDVV